MICWIDIETTGAVLLELENFLYDKLRGERPPLGGNTPSFDRAFIEYHGFGTHTQHFAPVG